MNERQTKSDERFSDIPDDKWLDSKQVYRAKRKHMELLGLMKENGKEPTLILDAGCGPGTYGIILAEKKGNMVYGIDISKKAIEKATQRAHEKGVNFFPMEGDLEVIPFEDAKFDIVFLGWTLHHFPSLTNICSEVNRVLKPGGKIAVVEPNEANVTLKFSRFVENMLSPVILKLGWDSPNRTIHTYKDYLQEFRKLGITNLKYSSCFTYLPPVGNRSNAGLNSIFKVLWNLRGLISNVSCRILPRPLNGIDILITGDKSGHADK